MFKKLRLLQLFISSKNPYNLKQQKRKSWNDRSVEAADLANQCFNLNGMRIADFGCGDQKLNQELKKKNKSIMYQGYDITIQSNDVIKIDLNKEVPLQSFDLIFCLGVLEYIKDFDSILKKLRPITKNLLLSYVVADNGFYTEAQLKELRWEHHFTSDQVVQKLEQAGFKIITKKLINNGKTLLAVLN